MTSALSYAVWGVIAVATVGLWAYSRQPRTAPARPSVVLQRLTSGPVLRIVLVAGWAWTGWHLFAR